MIQSTCKRVLLRMTLSHLFGLRDEGSKGELGSKLFIAVWREKAGWIFTFFLTILLNGFKVPQS